MGEIRGIRMGKSIHPGKFQKQNHNHTMHDDHTIITADDSDDGIPSIESIINKRNAPRLVESIPVTAPRVLSRRSNSRDSRTPNLTPSRDHMPMPTIRNNRVIRQGMM